MGQKTYVEDGVHFEGRYSNEKQKAYFTRLALIITGLGLAIGVPMVIWGIHVMGNTGNPWLALGSAAGVVVSEGTGVGILLKKT